MTLAAILAGTRPAVGRQSLGADRALAAEVQVALRRVGLLDGAPDGRFGPVSNWALDAFLSRLGLAEKGITATVAHALATSEPWPLRPGKDLAGRVVRAMLARGHEFCRHPGCVNIAYVEGMDPDGRLNGNPPDRFNDLRMAITCDADGVPRATAWDGTTEPGRYYVENPMVPEGAARIAFGQYKSWGVGTHPDGKGGGHEALVQVDAITVFRDLDRDFRRAGDKAFTGLFGVNQHWGYDLPPGEVRNASAGCLVGRTRKGHMQFMAMVKADARFLASRSYRFQTAVLDGKLVA